MAVSFGANEGQMVGGLGEMGLLPPLLIKYAVVLWAADYIVKVDG